MCDGVGYGVLLELEVRYLLKLKELVEIVFEWVMLNYIVYVVIFVRDSLVVKIKIVIDMLKLCFNYVFK